MSNNSNENNKQQEHIREIYSTKAANILKTSIPFGIFSLLTYLPALLLGSFDFGLIFETISFIFVLFSLNCIKKNNLHSCKRNIIISMIAIGWLVIYDFIISLILLSPWSLDFTLLVSISLLYWAYSDICKADGTQQSKDYLENFYDNL